jgi:hypothetical protein
VNDGKTKDDIHAACRLFYPNSVKRHLEIAVIMPVNTSKKNNDSEG